MRRLSSIRGFTLLETIVALSIMSVLTTAAISVVVHANRTRAQAFSRAQLVSDANLVSQMIGKDLSFLGVGVPRGYRMDTADFTSSIETHQLRPPVRIGQTDHFAFVGDLPYPNADLNGVVQIALIPSTALDELYVGSELSPCIPETSSPGSYSCNNHLRALVPGPVSGQFASTDECKQGQLTRLCPWGMNKWQGQTSSFVPLILGGVDGSWYERRWKPTTTTNTTDFATSGDYFGIRFSAGKGSSTGFNASASDGALPTNAFFMAKNSGGFAAHLDRVFWSFEQAGSPGSKCTNPTAGCVLLRRQCWGQVNDPGASSFPAVSSSNFRSDSTPSNCTAPLDGTDWETVVTGVQSFGLSYFTDTGTAITGAWDIDKSSDVGAVQIDLTLQKTIPGGNGVATYHQRQRFYLENAGGLVDPPAVFPVTKVVKARGTHGRCGGRRCGHRKRRH